MAFSNARLKPPPTPRSFWDTPVGQSLGDSSAVGWTKGGGGRGVVSQESNPAELGAADRDKDDSSLDPTVDGSNLDGASTSVSITPAGEEKPNHSPSLPMSSPHATAASSGDGGPELSGTVQAAVENTTANQNMKHEGGVPGEGVSTERMTAQGTGTKAVRSLSRMGGGGGGEELDEMGTAPTAILSGGALNSRGKLPSSR